MLKLRSALFVPLVGVFPQAARAQDAAPPKIVVSGTGALLSDYRFRGVSQTDKELAVQAGVTVTHRSGLYVGTWGSNLAGWGTFGGANMELDLIAGYKTELGKAAAIDLGLTWYMYPGGADRSDFAEPYAKLSGNVGAMALVAGVAYAPRQEALGNFSATPQSRGQKHDNLYLWGDAAAPVHGTPFTLKGHFGYSNGNPGLGPNGTSVAPTGEYLDWLFGIDATWKALTFGLAYVDTNIGRREAAYLQPGFSRNGNGITPIADGALVVSLTAAY
jgi:uncharacterized protein (TIGR02001 family)